MLGVGDSKKRLDDRSQGLSDLPCVPRRRCLVLAEQRVAPVMLRNHIALYVPSPDRGAETVARDLKRRAQCVIGAFPYVAEERFVMGKDDRLRGALHQAA